MDPFVPDPVTMRKREPKVDLTTFKINRASLKETALGGLSGNWCFALGTLLLGLITYAVIYLLLFTGVGYSVSSMFGDAAQGFSPFLPDKDALLSMLMFAPKSAGLVILLIVLASFIVRLLGKFIKLCISWVFIDFVRGEDCNATDIFNPFLEFRGRNLLAVFLVGFFIFLWGLVWIIPTVLILITGLFPLLLFILPLFMLPIIKKYSYSQTNYILKDNPELSACEAITLSREMMSGHKTELCVLELSFIGWFLLSVLTLGIGFIWLVPYYVTTKALYYDNLKKGYDAGYKQCMSTGDLVIILLVFIGIPALIILISIMLAITAFGAASNFKDIGLQMQSSKGSPSSHSWQNKKGKKRPTDREMEKEMEKALKELEREMARGGW